MKYIKESNILRAPTPKEIKDLRTDTGLTVSQASNLIHKTPRSFQRWERGEGNMPLAYWELFELKCRVVRARDGAMV
jgi:DNA-binding transcriptional regulator YiaG|tara:strand:+ start:133 stop:363 length:231 start_codon:yes stop_codon:yes gene_type:complete